ncbi:MAG: diacylglycerol/lipid kinase family protein [Aeromicrobium sp.]
MRSYSFLVNPLSGGGAAPAAVVPVARLLRDAGAEVEVTYSPGPKAMLSIVRDAAESGDVVVAVGGDGMLSSIAGELSRLDGVLGMIPAGRGNDFARMLKLHDEPERVAETLLHGAETAIDLISLEVPGSERRRVAGSVYSGVDARAGAIVDKVRWMPKKLQYPYAAVHSLATYVPSVFTVVADGQARTFRAATVVIANSGYYGKGMLIAPDASVTDGLLDVVVIGASSRREMIHAMPKVYDGSHVQLEQVETFRAAEVEISAAPAVPMGGDGEPLGMAPTRPEAPARVSVLPAALKVLI